MRSFQIDRCPLLLCSIVLSLAAMLPAAAARAEDLMLDLTLVTPSATENTYDVTYTLSNLPILGGPFSQVDTATSSGNVLATVNADFDPGTHAATATGIEFTGGSMILTDTQVFFDFGSDGTATFVATNIGGELDTPAPPSSVGAPSAGDFATDDHILNLDNGSITMTPTGNILTGLTFLGITVPVVHDLTMDPILALTIGETGNIDIMLASVIGNVATYDVRLEVPVDFSNDFMPGGGIIEILAAEGTIVAEGQFTRMVPEPTSILLSLIGAVLAIFLVRRM